MGVDIPTKEADEHTPLLVRVVSGGLGLATAVVIGPLVLYLLDVQDFWTLLVLIAGLAFLAGFVVGELFVRLLVLVWYLFGG
jgi:hypothetical protein